MSINQLSLQKTLFYLSILKFENKDISELSLKSISIVIYGTIIEKPIIEVLISDLENRLIFLLPNHIYRDEFTFSFTPEEFENINPKYYGRTISYSLQRKDNEIILVEMKY